MDPSLSATLALDLGCIALVGAAYRSRLRNTIGIAWPKGTPLHSAVAAYLLLLTEVMANAISSWAAPASTAPPWHGNADPIDLVLGLIQGLVLAPIAEEALFRGLLLGLASRRLNPILASVAVSAPFWALHGDPILRVDAFFLGMIFCYLRLMTGSLLPGILLHSAVNCMATIQRN